MTMFDPKKNIPLPWPVWQAGNSPRPTMGRSLLSRKRLKMVEAEPASADQPGAKKTWGP